MNVFVARAALGFALYFMWLIVALPFVAGAIVPRLGDAWVRTMVGFTFALGAILVCATVLAVIDVAGRHLRTPRR